MCVFVHTNAYAHRGQKRASQPPGLDLRAGVSLLAWVLRLKLMFCARTIHVLNCRVISSSLNVATLRKGANEDIH